MDTQVQEAERDRLREDMNGLLARAEEEGRDLSRRESAQMRELERTVEEIEDDMASRRQRGQGSRQISPQAPGTEQPGATLGREQRMSDWARERVSVPRSLEGVEGRDFSLGRMLRGMCVGSWEGAELERRALAEGTNAAGGFLTPEILGSSVIDKVRNQMRVTP